MPSVDLERREIAAGVGELAAWPPGPPRPGGWLGRARAELGARIHREWQREQQRADPDCEVEHPVALTHRVDGFRARVQGRVDGLSRRGGGLLVEEVKSTPDARAEHVLQLRLYGLCLAEAHPDAEIRGRLVLISPVDGSRRLLEVDLDPEGARRELEAKLRLLIGAERVRAGRARLRAAAADELEFPYPRPRPGQLELAEAVADGLSEGRPVLAAAPTGIGKTVSALLPALRFALTRDATLFWLTAKTSQQELVARTFADLAVEPLRAFTLRARARMCATGTLLCHPESCSLLAACRSRESVGSAVARLLADTPCVSPDRVFETGRELGLCPQVLSLALCAEVDLVICDCNYLYGPCGALELGGRRTVAVIDEAHNLFDRARGYDSPFLRRDRAAAAEARASAEGADFLRNLRAVLDRSQEEAAVDHPSGFDGHRPLPFRLAEWDELALEAARLTVQLSLERTPAPPDDPLLELLRRVSQVRDLLAADEPELVPYTCERGAGVLCVDPARRLHRRHREMLGTVAMSATLTPLPHWAALLGLSPLDPVEVDLPSPFPRENRRVVVVPTVSTAWRDRRRSSGEIARLIARVVGVRPGHYAAYFPSYGFLEQVRARLGSIGVRVLLQRPGMGEAERRRVLEELRTDREPSLLLAAMGGTLGEGIDLPGEALVGAILVGPGLPAVGFERECMRHHFQETTGDGFACAMLHPGMQRVIQSAGRVHRSPDDRGVIVLLGRRFATSPYIDCLPEHWHDGSPQELICNDPVPALEAFWREDDQLTGRVRSGPCETEAPASSSRSSAAAR